MSIDEEGAATAGPLVLEWPTPEVALVRLNRPRHLNAIDPAIVDGLPPLLRQLGDRSPACRVVVLTGTGRAFCAGVDLSQIDRGDEGAWAAADETAKGSWFLRTGTPDRLEGQERFADMVRTIRSLPQPVVAAVNGPAVGAGMALALACDVRLGDRRAAFHVGAVKIGLSAGECGITYLLPRLIGASRAFEVMLSGRPIEAEEAERIGLVSRIVDPEDLLGTTLELARSIVANAPFSVSMSKQLMWTNLDASSLDEALALENRTQILAFMTHDREEAVNAFLEKRTPRFSGS